MTKKNVIKKSALTPTVLIAGGAGFIGSHLAEALLKKGARVVVLDNFNTGKNLSVNDLIKTPNFALYNIDINYGLPPEVESVDYVFHFAGLEEYLFNKDIVNLDSLLTNALGTKNLLDLTSKSNGKFLLASSIDVYEGRMSQLELQGYFGKSTMDENKYSMTEAKRYAEALVWEYKKKNDTDARIVRLPEVYGPRMSLDASGSLGGFLKDVIEGRDLTVYGDGSQKEFYIYVHDAVSGIVKSLFNKNTNGNIYSLSGSKPLSALEIAYVVKSVADRPLGIKFSETIKESKPYIRLPDTYNLKDLDWEPRTDLKQGIMDTLSWLGYSVNEHAFKPSKLITDKKTAQGKPDEKSDEQLFSLSDVKDEIVIPTTPEPEVPQQPEEVPPFKVISSNAPIAQPVPSYNNSFMDGHATVKKQRKPFVNPLTKPLSSISAKIGKSYILGPVGIAVSALLIFLFLPAFQLLYFTKQSAGAFKELSSSVAQLDSGGVAKNSQKAYDSLTNSRRSLHQLKWVFVATQNQPVFSSYDKLFASLANFSKSGTYISGAVIPFENLWEVINPKSETKIDTKQFAEAKLSLSNARNYLQLAIADYKFVNKQHIPEFVTDEIRDYENHLYSGVENLDMITSVIIDLPEMLGSSTPKKYMLLFQNSNEIRPTGGFIGSYGILEFENGKISNLLIDDIYNPDGQINLRNIKITPPEPIAVFLSEDRLYLRNANWNPDFEVSAKTIEDLYFKVSGDKLDGLIAIDLAFVKNLMDATGPVFLTAYNEEINSSNIYERTQLHSEFNYQNGSDQKKSFLTLLGGKLLETVFSLPREKLPALFSKVLTSLDERHMLLYLENSQFSSVLKNKKWDGSLVKTDGDYLYIVNANVGGTKANYFVKNNYAYNISSKTRDGLLRASLEMKFQHTGEDNSWPGGPYTDYVRVLTPMGTKLTGAKTVTGVGIENDVMKDILISEENGLTYYEYFFELNPRAELTLIIEYDLPEYLSIVGEDKSYSLYWQKQPGTQDDQLKFNFEPPFGTQSHEYSKNLKLNSDQSSFSASQVLNTDASYYIKLR